MNIDKTIRFAPNYLSGDDAAIVEARLQRLATAIERQPKGMGWRIRSLLGDRVNWYREVEELERDYDGSWCSRISTAGITSNRPIAGICWNSDRGGRTTFCT